MRIERTRNASRNVVFGSILKIYQTIVPFIMRTAMIYCMGVEYLGLNSLFTSILSVLNLAELGVGSAMVFSMYQPIAEDDTRTICALMRLYKIYYRVIGLVIAIIGIVLTPFIPNLVHGDLPANLNIYVLYLFHLSSTVLSYWLFAYKTALLTAHQRDDVKNKVVLIVDTGLYAIQLFILFKVKNYYLYVLNVLVFQAVANIITAKVVDRMYPFYKAKGEMSKDEIRKINQRVADLFTSKVGAVIVNSADTIVISAFLGLTMLAVYQNYYYIMSTIIAFIGIIMSSCMAGIGNSLIVESKEKNYKDLNKLTFIISWIAGVCAACFLCLYQPFIKIWVGNDYLLPFSAVICICVYFYVYEINRLLNTFKDAGGIWHEDRFRPLITAFTNLGLNLLMVRRWGIYGIILSTVLSMLIVGMPWLIQNLFTTMFNQDHMKEYTYGLCTSGMIAVFACYVTHCICKLTYSEGWRAIVFRGLICIVVPNVIFYVAYRKKSIFKQCVQLADYMTKGRLNLEKYLCRN